MLLYIYLQYILIWCTDHIYLVLPPECICISVEFTGIMFEFSSWIPYSKIITCVLLELIITDKLFWKHDDPWPGSILVALNGPQKPRLRLQSPRVVDNTIVSGCLLPWHDPLGSFHRTYPSNWLALRLKVTWSPLWAWGGQDTASPFTWHVSSQFWACTGEKSVPLAWTYCEYLLLYTLAQHCRSTSKHVPHRRSTSKHAHHCMSTSKQCTSL